MVEEIQDKGVDPEEKQQEEESLKETPADEVRSSIIEKYGLNEEVDDELINKLVEDRVESNKSLSTAIKQKIGWRTKATQTEKKPEEKPQPQAQPKVEDIDKVLDQKLNEKLEERELQSLEVSDELKQQIKTYAKAGGLTVKQTLQSDFYKFLKEKEEAKQKVEEAAIGGKRRAPSRIDFSKVSLKDFDLSTEEGRKDYEEYKKIRKEKA